MSDEIHEAAHSAEYVCVHCGARLFHMEGHSGRYRWSDKADDTAILGSGSECPRNERGHEPAEEVRHG